MTRRTLAVLFVALTVVAVVSALGYAMPERSLDALERPREASDRLPANAGLLDYIDPGSAREVASFRLASGREHGVFLSRTKDGKQVCLFDTDLATGHQGGGCNDAGSVFAGRKIQISLGFEGGPSRATVRDVRIIGLAAADVESVRVELSDRTTRKVELTVDRAFAWAMPQGDLDRGLEPRAVVAIGPRGKTIDRADTGVLGGP
jgi:hypothetical protein